MNKVLITVIDAANSILLALFGVWNDVLTTLIIFMVLDCFSGLAVAAIFKNSPKTDNGGFKFQEGLKCLFRKICTITLIIIAYRVDILSGTEGHFVRDAVVLALCINESISIVENLRLMGLKIPEPLSRAINLLKNTIKDKDKSNNKEE